MGASALFAALGGSLGGDTRLCAANAPQVVLQGDGGRDRGVAMAYGSLALNRQAVPQNSKYVVLVVGKQTGAQVRDEELSFPGRYRAALCRLLMESFQGVAAGVAACG